MASWQYQNDDVKFVDFTAKDTAALEKAYLAAKPSTTLTIDGQRHGVNLQAFTQTNIKTAKERKIQRRGPDGVVEPNAKRAREESVEEVAAAAPSKPSALAHNLEGPVPPAAAAAAAVSAPGMRAVYSIPDDSPGVFEVADFTPDEHPSSAPLPSSAPRHAQPAHAVSSNAPPLPPPPASGEAIASLSATRADGATQLPLTFSESSQKWLIVAFGNKDFHSQEIEQYLPSDKPTRGKAFVSTFSTIFFSLDEKTPHAKTEAFQQALNTAGLGRCITHFNETLVSLPKFADLKLSEFSGHHMLCSPESLTELEARHISSLELIKNTAVISAVRNAWNKSAQLPIIGGESGSGKTMAGILSAFENKLIYIRSSDIGWSLKVESTWADSIAAARNPDANPSEQDVLLSRSTDAMKRIVRSVLRHSKAQSNVADLPAASKDAAEFEKRTMAAFSPSPGVKVVLFVDEVGAFPQLLRALIRCRKPLQETLKKVLAVDEVFLVVAGTGCDAATAAVGSACLEFQVISASPVDVHLLTRLLPKEELSLISTANSGVAAIARSALRNFRMLALFVIQSNNASKGFRDALFSNPDTCSRTPSSPVAADKAQLAYLQHLLVNAAAQYKRLNGMSGLGYQQTDYVLSVAMCLEMSQHSEDLDDSLRRLITTYGVLTDHAKVIAGNALDLTDKPRYRLSAAQRALMMLGYGRPCDATSDGFEQSVLNCIVHIMRALKLLRRFQDTALPALGGQAMQFRQLLLDAVKDSSCKEIVLVKLREKLEPARHEGKAVGRKLPEVLKDLVHRRDEGKKDLVILNAPRSAFADGVVMTASHTAFLQMKCFPGTVLQVYEVFAELFKMGHRGQAAMAGHVAKHVKEGSEDSTAIIKLAASKQLPAKRVVFELLNDPANKATLDGMALLKTARDAAGLVASLTPQNARPHTVRFVVVVLSTEENLRALDGITLPEDCMLVPVQQRSVPCEGQDWNMPSGDNMLYPTVLPQYTGTTAEPDARFIYNDANLLRPVLENLLEKEGILDAMKSGEKTT